jgi:hypothetical protein
MYGTELLLKSDPCAVIWEELLAEGAENGGGEVNEDNLDCGI